MKELPSWGLSKQSVSPVHNYSRNPLERMQLLAESSGERPHRPLVLASRRWRGGHESARAETCRDNLNQALGLTSGIFGKSKEGALGASGSLKSSLGACEKINQ